MSLGSATRSVLSVILLVQAALPNATEKAQFDYMINCQGCHLPDGTGMPSRGVPSASGFLGSFLTVPGGRAFLVQVPGAAQSDLDDQGLASVLNWMLETFSPSKLPEHFTPYTPDEVSELRRRPLIDVKNVRADLLSQIEQLERKRSQE